MQIRPEPRPEWLTEWEEVTQDPYVRSKLRRKIRTGEIMTFINYYIPELKGEDKAVDLSEVDSLEDDIQKKEKFIIDIGPGFCEFLEIARCYGHKILGVDGDFDVNGMGNEYLRACKLMAERQQVPVDYSGFDTWIENGFPVEDNSIDIINSIGSFDFVLRKCSEGTPGEKFGNDSKMLSVVLDDKLEGFLTKLFNELERTLRKDGCMMIHSNPTANQKEFAEYLMNFVEKNYTTIKCVISDKMTIFKFQKVV